MDSQHFIALVAGKGWARDLPSDEQGSIFPCLSFTGGACRHRKTKSRLMQGLFVAEINPEHLHPRELLSHQTILAPGSGSSCARVSAQPGCKTVAASMWHLLSAFPFLRSSKIHGLVCITYPRANCFFNCTVSDCFSHSAVLFPKEGNSPWGACLCLLASEGLANQCLPCNQCLPYMNSPLGCSLVAR